MDIDVERQVHEADAQTTSVFPHARLKGGRAIGLRTSASNKIFFDPACPDCVRSSAMGGAEVLQEVEQPTETYTPAEVSRALRDLSATHKTLLVKIARAYAWKTCYSHEDLIQEALTRVLEGKRAWPRKLPVAVFLRGVMRSIASDWIAESRDDAVNIDDIGYVNHAAAARIDVQKMFALFDDDPVAQKIFAAMLEGVKGEQLRQLSGLAPKDYETKRTKMRRRLEKWSP
jgi:DNA-directed RNA polymerase specialized sigma24 family protein